MEIVYQDDALVAVDKPPGLAVHRGWAAEDDVAMIRVRDRIGAWVYPVHRLDRGASGVLLFALTPEAARRIGEAFAAGEIGKRYTALVRGVPPVEGSIDHPIPRAEGGPRVVAVTDYRRLAVHGRYAVVEARPRTGRLHQIRKHLKHISCPLIGDVRYGKGEHNRLFRDRYGLHRLALHASALELAHPLTGAPMTIEAPLAADLAAAIEALATQRA